MDSLTKRVYELEGMLCEALQALEEFYKNRREFMAALLDQDPRLVPFYKAHTKKEETKVRKSAAKKLSARERQVLGIDANGCPLTR